MITDFEYRDDMADEAARPLGVLVTENDAHIRRFIERQIAAMGHNVIFADNAAQAQAILDNRQSRVGVDIAMIDRAVIMHEDFRMPSLRREGSFPAGIPLVIVGEEPFIDELFRESGRMIFYSLVRPFTESMLRAVLMAAVREVRQSHALEKTMHTRRQAFGLIETCCFRFRTIAEADQAALTAALCFDNPRRVVTGLRALAVNAVEHGNLEIGYDGKAALIHAGRWQDEIDCRLDISPYKERAAELTIARRDDGLYAVVRDDGSGFDWRPYMVIDPARAGHDHGRGIAQARAASFDRLAYNESGNQAVAFVRNKNSDGNNPG